MTGLPHGPPPRASLSPHLYNGHCGGEAFKLCPTLRDSSRILAPMNATNALLVAKFPSSGNSEGLSVLTLASVKCRLKGSDSSPIESAAAGNPGGYPAFDPLRDGVLSHLLAPAQFRV